MKAHICRLRPVGRPCQAGNKYVERTPLRWVPEMRFLVVKTGARAVMRGALAAGERKYYGRGYRSESQLVDKIGLETEDTYRISRGCHKDENLAFSPPCHAVVNALTGYTPSSACPWV